MSELAPAAPVTISVEDERLRRRLAAGDEHAFTALVDRHAAPLLRFAMVYVRDRAVAEEVVQETWLAVLQGIGRFESRSSLKTWLFRILANKAKTRAERERRTVPFSALAEPGEEPGESSVARDRFLAATHPSWPGHWAAPPTSWSGIPEDRLLARETLATIATAIEGLPPAQRQVILLRDVEGWPADEVCELLELSEANQRVLLHRARSRVRAALERYLDGA
jgi:RNA polymerase sigma-70 factor (ECF subfamily)